MSVKVVNRSSFRGIRKCPKCGLFNGNRAVNCKNSSCLSILQCPGRNRAEKNTPDGSSFAVHLHHQSPLYSVTHSNGLRSFIEHSSNEPDGKMLLRTVAGNSVKDANSVIQLILNCKSEAEPMPIKDAVIETLAVSEMDKNSLGKQQFPLVQRLFQDLYVVGQPDGVWQHVKAVRRKQIYTELQCSCHSERVAMNCWHKLATIAAMLSARHCYGARWAKLLQSFVKKESSPTPNPVLSYGTFPLSDCNIAAKCLTIGGSNVEYIDLGGSKLQSTEVIQQALFNDNDDQRFDLSDSLKIDVLSNGYELMIDDGTTATMASPISEVPDVFATAAIDDLQLMNCQIELMDEFDLTDRIDFCPSDVELIETEKLLLPTNGDENLSNASPDIEPLVEISTKKGAFLKGLTNEKLTKGSYSLRKLMRVLESNGIVFHRSARSAPSFEASVCNLSFVGWLEAVIEQLNSVIDYNRDGRPEQQIFRIHEDFFHCLRSRFSIGHGKRQPDSVSPVVDDEVVNSQHRALQTQHYKFSHHNSLQNVFRTDRMKLAFEKNFSRSTRGQFTAVDEEKAENPSSSNGRPIHPEYYSTFIKLGRYQHELNPHKVYSLSIAWTAGVLPRSGFGELRINFEYGHRMNGRYVAPPLS